MSCMFIHKYIQYIERRTIQTTSNYIQYKEGGDRVRKISQFYGEPAVFQAGETEEAGYPLRLFLWGSLPWGGGGVAGGYRRVTPHILSK